MGVNTFSDLTAEIYGAGGFSPGGANWHRHGFMKSMRRAMHEYEGDEDLCKGLSTVGKFIPDLWRMYFKQTVSDDLEPHVNENKVLYFEILEIEDTNPLSIDKLKKITSLWLLVDGSCSIELKLFVCDRYGANVRNLSLAHYALIFGKERMALRMGMTEPANPFRVFGAGSRH